VKQTVLAVERFDVRSVRRCREGAVTDRLSVQ
jgi:hypothetical protein